ncbi:MAG: heavy metal translocating P-type ATPase [Hyphomicrobiaceae bacterium]|nr:heavy metal translocating P-type ATPase [Hyphomicrobiaceae bacterium]
MAQALRAPVTERLADTGEPRAVPPAQTVTLAVEGMHCGGCMRKVETALMNVPGVTGARANLSARRVTAVVKGHDATPVALIEALGKAGFKAADLPMDRIKPLEGADDALLRRIGVAGFAAMNIMLLSVSVWSGHGDMGQSLQSLFHWLSALIALPAVAYAGQPFFRSGLQALKAGRVNMDVPISLGVLLATAMSLYQTMRGTEHVFFDAAVTLLLFLLIGRYLDQAVRVKAASAATNLLSLRGSVATVIAADGSSERMAAHKIAPGMRVLTASGERFAVDGRLMSGAAEIDESLITGETTPRAVQAGDRVYAGTVNLSGPVVSEATATDQNTLLAEISRLMLAAEQARGRYVRLADRAARMYAPAVHALGASTFIGWMLVGQGWEMALTAAIAVLIITCPCALALAVPAVQVAANSRLFGKGILLKAADGLERLAETDMVVFDKTGTITLGEPQLVGVEAIERDVLGRAAALAAASRHPYARAVVRAADAAGLTVAARSDVREMPGLGLEAAGEGGVERLGSAAWVDSKLPPDGRSGVYYRGSDGAIVRLAFEDRIRSDAKGVVGALTSAGFTVELLSGDQKPIVASVAAECGIATWTGAASPADKIHRLEALAAQGRRVLMVGDGLNDAPALAAGHASLSPASAADVSQVAADGVFQGERLAPILEAIAVARASRRMSLQNFAIAIGYNALFVPLAMAGYVTPLIAAIAMSASSIAVTVNAVRLRTMKLEIAS